MRDDRRVTVVSGFCPAELHLGQGFMQTFDRYWPEDIKLCVYVEEPIRLPVPRHKPRIEQRSLWSVPGVREFRALDNPMYHGKAPAPGWNKKDFRSEYSYRFDAVRFSPQLFIPDHMAGTLEDGDIMVWLDADVVSYAEVPNDLVGRLLGSHDLVTLGRDGSSTELGFWACKIGPKIREMLERISQMCRDRSIFSLYEWHSGYVFDHWVDRYKVDKVIDHVSLTRGQGHIWFQSEIGKYTDHLKGETRKKLGYSPERFNVTVKQYMRDGVPLP